jgi:hypothetical protein
MSRQLKTAGRRKERQPLVALKEESKQSVASAELDAPQTGASSSPFVIRSRTTVTPRFDFSVTKTQGKYSLFEALDQRMRKILLIPL